VNQLDKADADTERNRLQRMLETGLRAELLAGMANGGGEFEVFSLPHPDGVPDIAKVSLIDLLHDLMDEKSGALWRSFANVLQHSTDPEVKAMRMALADERAKAAGDFLMVTK